MNFDLLRQQLEIEEGVRLKPYVDTVGKVTIGIGHNLTDNGISQAVCDAIFKEDALGVVNDLNNNLPWWQTLDDVRQRVLADLCFNMGISTLLTFNDFLGYMKAGNWLAAALDLQHTKWASQVGQRALKLSHMLMTGQDVANG